MLEDLKEALVVYTSNAKDTARRHKALSEVGTSSDSVVLNEIVRIVRGMDMALLFEDADGANGDGDTVGTVEHDEQVHQGFPLLLHCLPSALILRPKMSSFSAHPLATGTTTQEPTTATIPMLDFFDPQVPFCIGFRLFNIVKERRFVAMMAESRIVALDTLVMSAPLVSSRKGFSLGGPRTGWCSPHLIRSYALDFGIGGLSYYVNQYIDRESRHSYLSDWPSICGLPVLPAHLFLLSPRAKVQTPPSDARASPIGEDGTRQLLSSLPHLPPFLSVVAVVELNVHNGDFYLACTLYNGDPYLVRSTACYHAHCSSFCRRLFGTVLIVNLSGHNGGPFSSWLTF
ncbi:hypothetical protein BKA70DRAFT_1450667 [Coprinopsis sp. MPI-PUGE-AT-0042]|nr:hypothetical protein BKA70DRAFT_1450667 [Coprinopsis sp. MPI-PUGE-AT-0042]